MYVSYLNKKDFALYNALSYDYHCSLLSGSLAAADSVTYGNNYKSLLNELEYFHVSYGQLPQDAMHILLEGIILHSLKLMLQYYVNHKGIFH